MATTSLAIGDRAPAFSLQTVGGKTMASSDFRGKRVVLYFYPKDDTPGCTREACGFRDEHAQFAKAQAVVLGVSRDDVASHERFTRKFGLTFPLLSDPGAAVAKAYGVYKQKSMYGRTYWGMERTTFVIDEQGRIAAIFPKVSVDGHIQAILEALAARRAPEGAPRARPAAGAVARRR